MPVIIYGTRGITYQVEKGQFNCPLCHAPRAYGRKRIRRFFTLYFIPLIPLDVAAEFVECAECKGKFDKAVLQYDQVQEQRQREAEFRIALRGSMLLTALADGDANPQELTAIRDIYCRLTETSEVEVDLASDIHAMRESGTTVRSLLGVTGPRMNNDSKTMVLKAALLVAQADGPVSEPELAVLSQIGACMQMSREAFYAVVPPPEQN
jgi:tellurite resistance protein